MDEKLQCHQCKADGDIRELNLEKGIYSFRGMLCKAHAEEMKTHFETLSDKK